MSLPNIFIEGRAVADPELRFTKGGKPVLNIRVAASDSRKDDAGNWETTEQLFVNVAAFDNAEALADRIVKGSRLNVAGRLYQREYEKSDGTKGQSLEIKFPMVSVLPDTRQGGSQSSAPSGWSAPSQPVADPWAGTGSSDGQPPF